MSFFQKNYHPVKTAGFNFHLKSVFQLQLLIIVLMHCGEFTKCHATEEAKDGKKTVRVIIESMPNYNEEQKAKAEAARLLAEKVINDNDFQSAVLSYRQQNQSLGFTQIDESLPSVQAKSNEAVLNALLGGNFSDSIIRLYLKVGYKVGEVGHTAFNTSRKAVTKTFWLRLNRMNSTELAIHYIHEHMHRMGFGHKSNYSLERCDSVPYAIGHLVCKIAQKKYDGVGSCEIKTNTKC